MVAGTSSASGWMSGWAPWGWIRLRTAARASSSAAITSRRARDRSAGPRPTSMSTIRYSAWASMISSRILARISESMM